MRSPGCNRSRAALVSVVDIYKDGLNVSGEDTPEYSYYEGDDDYGNYHETSYYVEGINVSVRPAMWINL